MIDPSFRTANFKVTVNELQNVEYCLLLAEFYPDYSTILKQSRTCNFITTEQKQSRDMNNEQSG